MNETVLIGSVALLWVLVLFNLVLTLGLVRRANANAGPQPMEEEGLEAGERAPDFTAETLDGEAVTLATYAGRDVAFLFMSPFCGPCREKLPRHRGPGSERAAGGDGAGLRQQRQRGRDAGTRGGARRRATGSGRVARE